MKKGFTILELLVASLLLGMLVTILTMIFNQSSIAWRTGVAGVAELDQVRDNVSSIREEADTLYLWGSDMHRLLPLWNEDGQLRSRAISADNESDEKATFLTGLSKDSDLERLTITSVGSGKTSGSIDTYMVNVKSAGPDKEFGTWDDIWSAPDDFE